jgi:16S rRNA (guanine(966)-N(2))-methyltransferase RsmD
MKVLKGKLKGKNIISPSNIRPLSVRVKKACFDILREEIKGKVILDLFAGSGSIGIEALSSEAKEVIFVDNKRRCRDTIKKNLTLFKLMPKAEVYLKDAFRIIKDFSRQKRIFDLIFLDPPYYKGMVKKSLQILEEYDILASLGYIVCFSYLKDSFNEKCHRYLLILNKKYGQTRLLIYRKR